MARAQQGSTDSEIRVLGISVLTLADWCQIHPKHVLPVFLVSAGDIDAMRACQTTPGPATTQAASSTYIQGSHDMQQHCITM